MMTVQEGVCPDGVFILCLVSFLAQGYAFLFLLIFILWENLDNVQFKDLNFEDYFYLKTSKECQESCKNNNKERLENPQ